MADFSGQTGRWIRHWRIDRGFTLQELAAAIDRSTSHLSLIENGKREPRLSTLQAIATTLDVPIASLVAEAAPSQRDALEVRLEELQAGEQYRSLGLPIVRASKGLSTDALAALVGLQEELGRRASITPATPEEARRANAELRLEMRNRDNYFEELEIKAQELLTAAGHHGGPVGERRIHQIAEHLGFSLATVQDLPHSTRSVTDLRNRTIYLPSSEANGHDPRTITLQAIGHHVLGHQTPSDYADFLRQRVEVNYFSAAVLMQETQAAEMLNRAKDGRYLAIEDLRDAFGVSYETAAHRFTNLITRHCGIRVHFLKVHENGLIYKAYENNGLTFPADHLGAVEGQAACREWASRQALLKGDDGTAHFQYTDTMQGTFWGLAKVVPSTSGPFAISIGVRFDDAKWFRGRETQVRRKSTCPDPSCCRRAPAALSNRWEGQAWPSARAQAHLLSALPPGSFPGVDETEVFEFLERHSTNATQTPV